MIDVKQAATDLARLTVLKFFPTEEPAQDAILQMACSMASNNQQIEWLVRRICQLFDSWPGPRTFRVIFCSRYSPRDGIDMVDAVQFPDGVPPEVPAQQFPQLPAPQSRMITADPELSEAFKGLVKSSRMPAAQLTRTERQRERTFAKLLEATITAPNSRADEEEAQ